MIYIIKTYTGVRSVALSGWVYPCFFVCPEGGVDKWAKTFAFMTDSSIGALPIARANIALIS